MFTNKEIQEALQEAEAIKAGKVKALSLKEFLAQLEYVADQMRPPKIYNSSLISFLKLSLVTNLFSRTLGKSSKSTFVDVLFEVGLQTVFQFF